MPDLALLVYAAPDDLVTPVLPGGGWVHVLLRLGRAGFVSGGRWVGSCVCRLLPCALLAATQIVLNVVGARGQAIVADTEQRLATRIGQAIFPEVAGAGLAPPRLDQPQPAVLRHLAELVVADLCHLTTSLPCQYLEVRQGRLGVLWVPDDATTGTACSDPRFSRYARAPLLPILDDRSHRL